VFVALQDAGSVAVAAARLGASASQHRRAPVRPARQTGHADPRRAGPAPARASHPGRGVRGCNRTGQDQPDQPAVAALATIDDLDASPTPVLVASLQARLPRCFVNAFSGRSDQIVACLVAR